MGGLRSLRSAVAPAIKNTMAFGAYHSGLYSLLSSKYVGMGVFLMLHRVCPDDRPILYPGYMVSTGQLDRLLAAIRGAQWDIVSLAEAERRLEQGDTSRRFVCFTFDDGYADNLTLALPVFEQYSAPMAVYVATGLLDRSVYYWWGALEELVTTRAVVDFPAVGDVPARRFATGTFAEQRRAHDTLDEMAHAIGAPFFAALDGVLKDAGIDPRAVLDRHAMTVPQARTLAASPLVTIGAHTISHARLATLGADDAWREIAEPRRMLQDTLGVSIDHLAYPFGGPNACGAREFEMAKKAGYQTAVTTRRGNIFPAHKDHLMCLPRRVVPYTPRDTWHALFGLETKYRGDPIFRTA